MADWYEAAILKALREREDVRVKAVHMIACHTDLDDEGAYEAGSEIETLVFGDRVECPHGCGSMNLPGAPGCWGCDEAL